MSNESRLRDITELLKKHEFLTVDQIAKFTYASSATIRRDLAVLADRRVIQRTRGGAVYRDMDSLFLPFANRNTEHVEEKKQIASLAIHLVKDDETIFLDGGSTCYTFAQELLAKERLTVINLGIMTSILLSNHKTICSNILCGQVRFRDKRVVGVGTMDYINRFHADWTFLSSPALDLNVGATTFDTLELDVKSQFRKNAKRTVLLMDSSKFGRSYSLIEYPLNEIQVIISDSKVSSSIRKQCKDLGIVLITNEKELYAYKKTLI